MARRFLTLPQWNLVSEAVHTSITINDTLCVQVRPYFIHGFSRITILPITMSFNASLSYCSTLDSSHAPSPWVSVEVLLLYVSGLTIWVYNRSNKQSITIIFIGEIELRCNVWRCWCRRTSFLEAAGRVSRSSNQCRFGAWSLRALLRHIMEGCTNWPLFTSDAGAFLFLSL